MTGTDNKAEAEEKFSYVLAQERGRGAKAWKYRTRMAECNVDGAAIKEVALSWEGETDATGQDVTDALSRDEKRTERDYADQLAAYLQANGGTAAQEDCKKALGFPKVNWTRVRDKAGVKSDVQSGGGKGGSSAVWVLGSENTGKAAKTVTVTHSDSTYTNIEPIPIVFSGTSPKIPTREYNREYNKGTDVLSEDVLSNRSLPSCPKCGSFALYHGECQTCGQG